VSPDPDPFAGRHPDDLAYPRQTARTQGFTLGVPRTFTANDERVVFLRSNAGDDPVTCLWVLDLASGAERCVFDPRGDGGDEPTLTTAERARRERLRERAKGITAYSCDEDLRRAVFLDSGRLLVADLQGTEVVEIPVEGTPDDPRLSPDGSQVAYVIDGALWVSPVDGGAARCLAAEPGVTWGLAEFAAAEEMGRYRGHWWSPDGARIAACRVDESMVHEWWIGDPTAPSSAPYPIRYPQAGTTDAEVTLHVIDVVSGDRSEVSWDRSTYGYLTRVSWEAGSPLTLQVMDRAQRSLLTLTADDAGTTTTVEHDTDPVWVEMVDGSPARLSDGTLVRTVDTDGARALAIGDDVVTTPPVHVDGIVAAGDDHVVVRAWTGDPTSGQVLRVGRDGEVTPLTTDPGDHLGAGSAATVVVKTYPEDGVYPVITVRRGDDPPVTIASNPETPVVDARPVFGELGERGLHAALVTPAGHDGVSPLPVLLSPYGGPHAQEVVRTRAAFREQQWFADRLGAAVLTIDGRGTPGRGTTWERAIHLDFSMTLDDQVDGLHAAAERWPFLDLGRVAMRGWSFGGWLSAMAVLRRPEVFHAAVAGAPVTDFRLYDTFYTERYLGLPDEQPEVYERDAPITHAASLERPLLLIHGLADDNVVAANTLQLSAALFAAGRHHDLVLLPNASHIGGSGDLVVGRYLAELDFLRRSLGLEPPA
jgi:dipeptidyl-peptidase-4